jgi:hypothetical protein
MADHGTSLSTPPAEETSPIVKPPTAPSQIRRIGILQCITDFDDSALRYLILSLNSLQSAFQVEFVPFNADDPFLQPLLGRNITGRPTSGAMLEFHYRQTNHCQNIAKKYNQSSEAPDCFQIISTASFNGNYFYTSNGFISVIALGKWKEALAPPSILEFILALVLQGAVGAVCPDLDTHLGTRGCLYDFCAELSDARQKALAIGVCRSCESIISDSGHPDLVGDLRVILSKRWLGSRADPTSPAAIISKLKRDLFITKGLEPGWIERARMTLMQEGIKQILAIVGIVVAAILIAVFGVVNEVHLTQPATSPSSTSSPAPSPSRP